jgi:hypothetical protein
MAIKASKFAVPSFVPSEEKAA